MIDKLTDEEFKNKLLNKYSVITPKERICFYIMWVLVIGFICSTIVLYHHIETEYQLELRHETIQEKVWSKKKRRYEWKTTRNFYKMDMNTE